MGELMAVPALGVCLPNARIAGRIVRLVTIMAMTWQNNGEWEQRR